MMKRIAQWLERLSLDAVIVAVVWGSALAGLSGKTGFFHNVFILGLATWLTYVADRLWEVRPGKRVPDTDRHLYYRRNYRQFLYLWLSLFAGTVLYALVFLPGWMLVWGLGVVAVIVGYLYCLTRISNKSSWLLFKRVLVPVIFAGGIALMTEAWRHVDSIAGLVVLLSAAFSNVLLISYQENRDKEMPRWLPSLTIRSVFALLVFSNAALFLHWPAGLVGILCSGIYFWLHLWITAGKLSHIRIWVDGTLAVSGLLLLLLP